MKEYKLSNGMKVIIEKRSTASVAIEINVHVGSNNESKGTYGISHFIEHLLFEGTPKRPNSMLISNEIEKIGGEINAATANERTFYFCKVPKKHFSVALDVLSDIIQNPLFENASVEKERKIIVDEINMVTDDPKFHQWILFQQTLFSKHPAKNPVYGSKASVKKIKRDDIIEYYKKYYVPNNMTITVVGNINGILSEIKTALKDFFRKPLQKSSRVIEPRITRAKTVKEKKDILQSYMVLGYKVPPRNHKDSYVLDVIRGYLGRGQSGRLFQEIRVKHGLAYDVGVLHEPNIDYGLFAVYVGTHKKNIIKCRDIIIKELNTLIEMTDESIHEAKTFVEGEFLLSTEDNFKFADTLSFFSMTHSAAAAYDFVNNIKDVSLEDIKRVSKKYLNDKYTMTVIEQK